MVATIVSGPAPWVALCGKAAPIASVAVFMAPIPTIQKIDDEKSIGNLPLLPYSSMVVNSFLWVTYGVLKKQSKVWAPNGVGLLLGTYYCWKFQKYCPKKTTQLPGTITQHWNGSMALIMFTTLLAGSVQIDLASNIIGKLGVLLCILMFASPLAALKTVIETKSAKSIPLPFTLACFLNCFFWMITGVLELKDFNIYFPNILGLSSAVLQIILRLVYGDGSMRGPALPI